MTYFTLRTIAICVLILSTQHVNVYANTPLADIFYGMNQTPVTIAGAVTDATENTSGTLSNIGNGMPILVQGANSNTQSAWDFSQTDNYIRVASNPITASLGDITATDGMTIGFWAKLDYNSSFIHSRVAGMGNTFDILMHTQNQSVCK